MTEEGNVDSEQDVGLEDEISLDDIDSLLAEDDPDFAANMEEIGAVTVDKDSVNIDATEADDDSIDVEDEAGKSGRLAFLKRITIFKWIKAPFVWVGGKISSAFRGGKNRSVYLFSKALTYFKEDFPKHLKVGITSAQAGFTAVRTSLGDFLSRPLKEKLLFLVFMVALGGIGFLVNQNISGQWISSLYQPETASLSEHADLTVKFNPEKELRPFYLAFPQPEFIFHFKRVVVNLTRTRGFRNPMLAFRFYVNVDSRETAIEIKDRKKEMIDIVQREVEGLTYPEVNRKGGRLKTKKLIRRGINGALNQGFVKEVYIDLFVLKR